jgi:hypothetical protein
MSRKHRGPAHIRLNQWMLVMPVWRSLPNDSKAILVDLWSRHDGQNNGRIVYSVRDAKAVGVSRGQAQRMLKILVERGFLAVMKESAFTLKTREARLWRLTAESYGSQKATMDFMRWRPPEIQNTVPKSTSTVPPVGPCATILPASVPRVGPREPVSAGLQSQAWDTLYTCTSPHGPQQRSLVADVKHQAEQMAIRRGGR